MSLEYRRGIAKRFVELERIRIDNRDQHGDCYVDRDGIDGRCSSCWSMDNAYAWVHKQEDAVALFDWAYDHVATKEEADACGI